MKQTLLSRIAKMKKKIKETNLNNKLHNTLLFAILYKINDP